MGEQIPDEEFHEYTAHELAAALLRMPAGHPVAIEVQDEYGAILANEVMRLHVREGHDFDRIESYTWTDIIARLESDRTANTFGASWPAATVPMGWQKALTDPDGKERLYRLIDRRDDPTDPGRVVLVFTLGGENREEFLHWRDRKLVVFPPEFRL